MAIAFGATVESAAQNKTSGTTLTFQPDSTVAVGDLLVICMACDNNNATTPTVTCADNSASGGTANAYTVTTRNSGQALPGAGVAGSLIYCLVTRQIETTDTITATLSNAVTPKALVAQTFTGASGSLRGTAAVASATSGTAASVANTNPLSGDLVVAMVTSEGITTGADSDTTNGSWSTQVQLGTTGGSDAANVKVSMQYKVVTATGTQTFDSTVQNSDWACISVAFQPTAAAASLVPLRPIISHLRGR